MGPITRKTELDAQRCSMHGYRSALIRIRQHSRTSWRTTCPARVARLGKARRSRHLPPRRLAPQNYQDADREIYEPHGLVNCDALVPVGYAVADASQVIDAL